LAQNAKQNISNEILQSTLSTDSHVNSVEKLSIRFRHKTLQSTLSKI
jgi:hypothetical protein